MIFCGVGFNGAFRLWSALRCTVYMKRIATLLFIAKCQRQPHSGLFGLVGACYYYIPYLVFCQEKNYYILWFFIFHFMVTLGQFAIFFYIFLCILTIDIFALMKKSGRIFERLFMFDKKTLLFSTFFLYIVILSTKISIYSCNAWVAGNM